MQGYIQVQFQQQSQRIKGGKKTKHKLIHRQHTHKLQQRSVVFETKFCKTGIMGLGTVLSIEIRLRLKRTSLLN
jgi:hypothetical protein